MFHCCSTEYLIWMKNNCILPLHIFKILPTTCPYFIVRGICIFCFNFMQDVSWCNLWRTFRNYWIELPTIIILMNLFESEATWRSWGCERERRNRQSCHERSENALYIFTFCVDTDVNVVRCALVVSETLSAAMYNAVRAFSCNRWRIMAVHY